jgi:hypothetical protein
MRSGHRSLQRLGIAVSGQDASGRSDDLDYDGFRRLATDPSLSRYQKIGFPDAYRQGSEALIFEDILAKVPPLLSTNACVLDIGPGCSDLPRMLIDHTSHHDQHLHLVDSAEMLALLPDAPNTTKTPARFPDCPFLLETLDGNVDALIVYSVLQYAFAAGELHRFFEAALATLAPGGHALFGDIPNASRRARFLRSAAGREFHRNFSGRDEDPPAHLLHAMPGQIDDAVVLSLLRRARDAGFDAFVMPQRSSLPMANRREDVLVVRP